MSDPVPAGLRALYASAGPIIRYRLLRDVLDRDESYIETAHLGLDIARIPEIKELVKGQSPDATWNGKILATDSALLRLCELGRESSIAVTACVEKVLLPTLFDEHVLWEFADPRADENYQRAARHIVRDKTLRLICRATREADAVIRPHLEAVLAEWNLFLSAPAGKATVAPPTADAWAAVCWYPWPDDDLDRVHDLAVRLLQRAEEMLGLPAIPPLTGRSEQPLFAPYLFRLHEKWEYLARPPLLLHDLELAARLGIVRDHVATDWMLEELEAHQDADGFVRFELEEPLTTDWYFPLEARSVDSFPVEWTFRTALIFRLLAYDL
jgi:hypothetical protein